MKNSTFFNMFTDFLADLYDAENQIVESLPEMIQNCTNTDLKEGLTDHLKETKDQVVRLEQIFSLLDVKPKKKSCAAMKGLIKEGSEILEKSELTSALKDCFIIISAQKIEHYEIASYGSAIALVEHLKSACSDKTELKDVCKLLEETLKEEKKADKKLNQVAEGKLFIGGVNDDIELEIKETF